MPLNSADIHHALASTERQEHVRILYACESGSRAWGFPSADSDFDVRFIYVRPALDYLRLDPPRDVIERLDHPLDLNGWDLFKACHLLRRTNPPLLEWLDSPIVYHDDHILAPAFRAIAAEHFNVRACGEHYLSVASGHMQKYIIGRERVGKKRYLYALRPLMCLEWLLTRGTMPPTDYRHLLDEIAPAPSLRAAIDELIASKRDEREIDATARVTVFDDYLERGLQEYQTRLAKVAGQKVPIESLNALIRRYLG